MPNGRTWMRPVAQVTAAAWLCGAAFLGAALVGAAADAGPAAAAGASAITVEAAEFFVSLDDEGNERRFVSNLVPYLPNQACFGWRIRLAGAPSVVRVREVLHLPEAPAFWSGEDDEFSTHVFSADRTTATTEEYKVPQAGWIDNEWCIVEGDPTGPHSIEVFVGEDLLRHFDFEVKTPGQPTGN
jgi:hypothetical protein